MMWGLDPNAISGLMLLAFSGACPPQGIPQVQMQTVNTPAQFSTSLSSAELGNFPVSTVVARHSNEIFVTGGITRGQITTSYDMAFNKLLNSATQMACIWPKQVRVTVSYAPIVYIAREYRPGSCRYNTTMEHELRHVNTDVITLNEYLPRIQNAVQGVVNALGVRGPMPDHAATAQQEAMVDAIAGRLKGILAEMDAVRMQRQQQIDTRQEYMRLGKVCAHEKNPIAIPQQQRRQRR
jgi:hypothetical protein